MKTLNISGYSSSEERANTYSHGLGIVLSLVGLIYLVFVFNDFSDHKKTFSYIIYTLSLLALYSASTMYHFVKDESLKLRYKKLDHICIYYLIAGNYTPLMLNHVPGSLGLYITLGVWAIALFGTFYKLFAKKQNKIISVSIYLLMGWLVVLFWPDVSKSLSQSGLDFLIYGGIFYTGGVVFYLLKKVPYTHSIWHLCVLAGSVCHYIAVITA
ncbi:hemolysin III family protein [Halobacteriovorax sp. HLS]|uniref:PAQR family membrane homeostasis protein TrhA n=1 Tax=Halobacteriovorax sp. HLS TaxID=2234000 RepID=UPI000FDAF20C|nr:hemolysin III family protein [Halobacteriovorax sp. HLS]